jgi:ABC-type amino acid transport system permease subunit
VLAAKTFRARRATLTGMKSYSGEIGTQRLCGDDIDCRQTPFSYQPEGAYGRQLLWHLIATVLLVAITALAWLSLIGFAPGADAHTNPSKQSISTRNF